jgi:hypothetical protein
MRDVDGATSLARLYEGLVRRFDVLRILFGTKSDGTWTRLRLRLSTPR